MYFFLRFYLTEGAFIYAKTHILLRKFTPKTHILLRKTLILLGKYRIEKGYFITQIYTTYTHTHIIHIHNLYTTKKGYFITQKGVKHYAKRGISLRKKKSKPRIYAFCGFEISPLLLNTLKYSQSTPPPALKRRQCGIICL